MQEYMLRILNKINHQAGWPPERHIEFVKRCEKYIGELKEGGHLIAAQPLAKTGKIISGVSGSWQETPLTDSGEIQVGYYHIRAGNLLDAIKLAKGNPEFEFSTTARIEVRPITEKAEETGFVYPTST